MAETGLSTVETPRCTSAMPAAFSESYPAVRIHRERVLVISGQHEELVYSGASTTWHDLVLYLYARFAEATTAQEVARLIKLQWHQDGLASKERTTRSGPRQRPTPGGIPLMGQERRSASRRTIARRVCRAAGTGGGT